jgi:hypothetical protein
MAHSPYAFGERAFLRDRYNNEYTHEALYVAMLLHCSVKGGRTEENINEVALLLDDPNLKD